MALAQEELIRSLKGTPGWRQSLRLPIEDNDGTARGYLVPITREAADDPEICAALFDWRNQYMHLFLSMYRNSPEKAQAWLKNDVLEDPARLPFLIYTVDGTLVGNCGVSGITKKTAELDTMMRGSPKGGGGLMKQAQMSLVHWAFSALSVGEVSGRLLSTNVVARRFHAEFGLRERSRVSLRKEVSADGYRLVEDPDTPADRSDPYLILAFMDQSTFYQRYPWMKLRKLPAAFTPNIGQPNLDGK